LETQAYVAWCEGMLQFELQEWKPAIENLKEAQSVENINYCMKT